MSAWPRSLLCRRLQGERAGHARGAQLIFHALQRQPQRGKLLRLHDRPVQRDLFSDRALAILPAGRHGGGPVALASMPLMTASSSAVGAGGRSLNMAGWGWASPLRMASTAALTCFSFVSEPSATKEATRRCSGTLVAHLVRNGGMARTTGARLQQLPRPNETSLALCSMVARRRGEGLTHSCKPNRAPRGRPLQLSLRRP
jgi:hypothetical protein